MSARDVAIELPMTRVLDRGDGKLLRLMIKRVGVAVRIQRDTGAVRTVPSPGQVSVWEVAR